jgi:hypothetical protein
MHTTAEGKANWPGDIAFVRVCSFLFGQDFGWEAKPWVYTTFRMGEIARKAKTVGTYMSGLISLWLYKEHKIREYLLYIFPLSSTHLWFRCSNPSKKNSFGCAANRRSQRIISTPTFFIQLHLRFIHENVKQKKKSVKYRQTWELCNTLYCSSDLMVPGPTCAWRSKPRLGWKNVVLLSELRGIFGI